jgi:hypothetical protein
MPIAFSLTHLLAVVVAVVLGVLLGPYAAPALAAIAVALVLVAAAAGLPPLLFSKECCRRRADFRVSVCALCASISATLLTISAMFWLAR